MTVKRRWVTYSLRIAPGRAVALQTRIPLTPQEWRKFMDELEKKRPEMVDCEHNWIDITTVGATDQQFLCTTCSGIEHRPWPEMVDFNA